jgi:hypothetical protein
VIDGEKTIIQNPSEAQRKEHDKYEFDVHEVYAIDVLISTGEGQVIYLRTCLIAVSAHFLTLPRDGSATRR